MTPIQAFELAIVWGIMGHKGARPGSVVERLPPEAREALAKLTSDDIRTHGTRDMSRSD